MMLLEQVTWNLFTSYVIPLSVTSCADAGVEPFGADPQFSFDGGIAAKLFFPCDEVEDAYQVYRVSPVHGRVILFL